MCKLMLLVDYAKEERRDIHLKIPRNIGTFHILRRDKLAPDDRLIQQHWDRRIVLLSPYVITGSDDSTRP